MLPTEHTLDPVSWNEFKSLSHEIVEELIEHTRTVRDRPAWSKPGNAAAEVIKRKPLPDGAPLAEVLDEFREHILTHPLGNGHPRHWGWVNGTGTPLGALADYMASTMNPNCWGAQHAPNLVETAVIDWLKSYLGFPPDATGVLVTGGSAATFNGLATARNLRCGWDVRADGVAPAGAPPVSFYLTEEAHFSAQRAIEVLGHGSNSIRWVPMLGYTMDPDALSHLIRKDIEEGVRPIAVVATIGTVKSGAIDPLPELADIAAQTGTWLHVDGAFGAMVKFAQKYHWLADGLERADSIAFDLHKWAYQPYDVACSMVRHPDAQAETFGVTPSYLAQLDGGVATPETQFSDLGVDLSRGFRALKLWFAFRTHGPHVLGRLIDQNIDQAKYLTTLISEQTELDVMAETTLNIVLYRFVGKGEPGDCSDRLNRLNQRLLIELQERGCATPSSTVLGDQFVLRVAITNHRTRNEDLRYLVEKSIEIGRELQNEF